MNGTMPQSGRPVAWRWWGAAAGVLLAAFDTAGLAVLGVRFALNGRSVGLPVALYFATSFALLGFLIGWIVESRARERGAAAVIREQMQAISDARVRLAQSEKLAALGQLAAAIAHEVRTPLAVIRSSAQGLCESLPAGDAEAARASSFITAEIDRLRNVIQALLAFARPLQLAAVRSRPTSCSIVSTCSRATTSPPSASASAARRPRRCRRSTPIRTWLPGAARSPGERRRRDARRRRGGAQRAGDGAAVEIAVADSGPGVPPELRERIFEPFFTTRARGIGLGLAVARQIVEAHGGTIAVPRAPRAARASPSGCRSPAAASSPHDPRRVSRGAASSPGRRRKSPGETPQVKRRVLIVDDEERMAEVIASALRRAGYDCETAPDGREALAALESRGADVVVTDWKMPQMDGLELLRRVRETRRDVPVILLTAHGTVPSAVAAMREGAFDYVTKPFDNDELRAVVGRALEMHRLERENRYLRQEVGSRYAPETMVAESARGQELLELVRRVAPSRATVLIQGESGTGKELVARLLHFWSERVGGPFVPVNCKAFAEGVLESELFGHERGAFTGAAAARAGCFERASGGTLFLDEIGEVGVDFQAKLLRVLQDGEVMRVGGGEPRPIDVRVVAATNRNLREEIAAGRFREDLFFRLNVIPIQLAPLRDRREDVLPLARHFLARDNAEAGRRLTFSPEAEAALSAHPWRGNVRELENVVERAVVLARGDAIAPEDLLLEEGDASRMLGETATTAADASSGSLQECLDRAAAERIAAALVEADGQRAAAARALGIDRTTLYRLMKRLGLAGGVAGAR